ncbi:MAG: hypothetical protein ABFQ53_03130 [Patescibacteria group bacterium]
MKELAWLIFGVPILVWLMVIFFKNFFGFTSSKIHKDKKGKGGLFDYSDDV